MSKDIKLNRLQWTQKQVEKKYEAYQKMVEEDQNENDQWNIFSWRFTWFICIFVTFFIKMIHIGYPI